MPVTDSVAMRGWPSPRAVPAGVTPKPAMVSVSPGATRRGAASAAGIRFRQGCGQLDERDIGGGAACRVARNVEMRMPDNSAHRDGDAGLVSLDLVFAVAQQAVRGGEHQVARKRGAGDRSSRASTIITIRRRSAARGALPVTADAASQQNGKCGNERRHAPCMSLARAFVNNRIRKGASCVIDSHHAARDRAADARGGESLSARRDRRR